MWESAWPEPVERVSAVLRAAAVEARIEELPGGTTTARAAAAAIGCDAGDVVESLVFVCDGRYVLALVPGDRSADEAAVAAATGAADVRIARADEVLGATGFQPGAAAPFPLAAVEVVLIDRSLLGRGLVWIHAGSPSHMAALPSADLQRLANARTVVLTTHG